MNGSCKLKNCEKKEQKTGAFLKLSSFFKLPTVYIHPVQLMLFFAMKGLFHSKEIT